MFYFLFFTILLSYLVSLYYFIFMFFKLLLFNGLTFKVDFSSSLPLDFLVFFCVFSFLCLLLFRSLNLCLLISLLCFVSNISVFNCFLLDSSLTIVPLFYSYSGSHVLFPFPFYFVPWFINTFLIFFIYLCFVC